MNNTEIMQKIWFAVLHLVRRYDYSVFHIDGEHELEGHYFEHMPEIVLVKREGGHAHFVRMAAVDFIWSPVLQRDMEKVRSSAEHWRKRIGAKRSNTFNIYVFRDGREQSAFEEIRQSPVRSEGNDPVYHLYYIAESGEIRSNASLELGGLTEDDLKSLFAEAGERSVRELIDEVSEVEKQRERELTSIFRAGKPFWTYTLVIVNILMFLWLSINGGSTNEATLIQYGAKYNPLLIEGEWWRLLTPMFLHIGFAHLLVNSFALYVLGGLVERIYGSVRFLFIYLTAGVFGTLASFLFVSEISAGASGAIYGCFGALLYFGTQYKDLFKRTIGRDVLIILVINIAISIFLPFIDLFGHLGGLIGGFIGASVTALPAKKTKAWLRASVFAASVALILGGWQYGVETGKNSAEYMHYQAKQWIQEEHYLEAEELLRKIIDKGEGNFQSHFDLAFVLLKQNKFQEGKDQLLIALDYYERSAVAHYNLALVYRNEGNTEFALKHAKRALELRPDFPEAKDLLEMLQRTSS